MDPAETFANLVMTLPKPEVSPSVLEGMGKRAAALHLAQGMDLNEAVPMVVKEAEHPLGPEHIQRVVEFANQNTHIGYMSQGEEYPSFKVAEPHHVHNEVAGSGEPPPQTDPFSAEPEVKVASFDPGYQASASEHELASLALFTQDMQRSKIALDGRAEHLQSRIDQLENMRKQAQSDFFHRAKRHLLMDGSVSDIARMACGVDGGGFSKAAMGELVEWLSEQVPESLIVESLEKQASGKVPNPGHPMVQAFAALVKVSMDLHTAKGFRDNLVDMSSGIGKELRARATV